MLNKGTEVVIYTVVRRRLGCLTAERSLMCGLQLLTSLDILCPLMFVQRL